LSKNDEAKKQIVCQKGMKQKSKSRTTKGFIKKQVSNKLERIYALQIWHLSQNKFMFCSAAFNLGEYYSNQLKQNEKKDELGK